MSLIPNRLKMDSLQREDVITLLVRRFNLSKSDVYAIEELCRSGEMSFTDAACHLGLIEPSDVDDAVRQVSEALLTDSAVASEKLSMIGDPFSPRSERIRSLRNEILLRAEEGDDFAFTVIGSDNNDEHRALAVELGVAFAQLGEPTLLIDSDMRPAKDGTARADYFRCETSPGLAEMLTGESPFQVRSVENAHNLHVAVAGSTTENALELLTTKAFARLLDVARARYKYVIVMTGNAAQHSDPFAVASHVGQVLISARYGKTRYNDMTELLRRINATRANILGTTVTPRSG